MSDDNDPITCYDGAVLNMSVKPVRENLRPYLNPDEDLILVFEIDPKQFLLAGRRKHVYYLTRAQQKELARLMSLPESGTL